MPDHINKPHAGNKIDIWSRTIIALALGMLLGAALSLIGLRTLQEHIPTLLTGFFVLLALIGLIVLFLVMNKEWVLKKLFGVTNTDLSEIKDRGQSLFFNTWNKEYDAAKVDFEALYTKIFAWYSWMSFRRWIILIFNTLFVSFGGLLGTVLIFNQNKLLLQQNQLMQNQNYRLDQQTYLQEADRRSSLIFLMGNLLDAIDQELKSDIGKPGIRDLSPQIIGRVVALSKSLRPYRYLQGDSLVAQEISPERGQLLLSIVNSQIDNSSLRRIFQVADFSFADLKGAVLSGEFLTGINLRHADLSESTMDETDLSRSELSGADLSDAVLARANLREARFRESKMTNTYLESADLTQANLYGANMRGANLGGAKLQQTHFTQANLTGANLLGATLLRTGFNQAILDSAQVGDMDWISQLPAVGQDSIRGLNYLSTHYRVDSVQTPIRTKFMLIKKSE